MGHAHRIRYTIMMREIHLCILIDLLSSSLVEILVRLATRSLSIVIASLRHLVVNLHGEVSILGTSGHDVVVASFAAPIPTIRANG